MAKVVVDKRPHFNVHSHTDRVILFASTSDPPLSHTGPLPHPHLHACPFHNFLTIRRPTDPYKFLAVRGSNHFPKHAKPLLAPMSSSRALQWLSLVGIIWLQSINGTNTNFPAYSSELKHLLSISQVQLNNLAFASDAGKLLGWFSGVAAVYLPLWLVLLIGSSLGLFGYGLQYLFVTNQISFLSYWHIFILTVIAGNSICWINTVSYVVAIRNFPSDRQVVVGLTTSYLGLSAKVYTDIVGAVFPPSPHERAKAYLLLNSVLPVIICAIAAPLVREVDVGRPGDMKIGFIAMFVITVATGVYSVISSLASISGKLSSWSHVIGTGVFLLVPLVIPVAEKIIELVRKYWGISTESKVYHFTIDESEGSTVERMENGVKEREEAIDESEDSTVERMENRVKEREEAGEVCEVGIKEEIGVMVMVRAGPSPFKSSRVSSRSWVGPRQVPARS